MLGPFVVIGGDDRTVVVVDVAEVGKVDPTSGAGRGDRKFHGYVMLASAVPCSPLGNWKVAITHSSVWVSQAPSDSNSVLQDQFTAWATGRIRIAWMQDEPRSSEGPPASFQDQRTMGGPGAGSHGDIECLRSPMVPSLISSSRQAKIGWSA